MKILKNDANLMRAAEHISDSNELKQQLRDYSLRLEFQAKEEEQAMRNRGELLNSQDS